MSKPLHAKFTYTLASTDQVLSELDRLATPPHDFTLRAADIKQRSQPIPRPALFTSLRAHAERSLGDKRANIVAQLARVLENAISL